MSKVSDATKNLMYMEEKRAELLDNCTRALCGDATVNGALLDEATGGRYSAMTEQDDVDEQIKTLLLALRWLGLPPEKKTRKRRASAKTAGKPAKKRGRPKGSKNKDKGKDNGAQTDTRTSAPPPAEPPAEQQPSA